MFDHFLFIHQSVLGEKRVSLWLVNYGGILVPNKQCLHPEFLVKTSNCQLYVLNQPNSFAVKLHIVDPVEIQIPICMLFAYFLSSINVLLSIIILRTSDCLSASSAQQKQK